jgi:predicted unusual protein kinase regulating ubiquinone biosynthesis (AarF/ABC1/UbiB family)
VWHAPQVFETLSPAPIAAASLGQVYKGRLRSGETVAVKVQRPYVLETVSIDLFVIRHAPTCHRSAGISSADVCGADICSADMSGLS